MKAVVAWQLALTAAAERRSDKGQTAVEYLGIIAVVAAIIAVIVGTDIGETIFEAIQKKVDEVAGN
ncbi:hypothetical protein ACFQLX_03515 [Streptomyces polyrhachis]|uniref:Flp family type IVb pilin n=1 Tax=Streptomyces polyrhachis TaxID=1282885 RepID=A0ABW2GE12_9ACTN